ncbi:MAG: NPP1 family protein [Pseudomonadales bacterium]
MKHFKHINRVSTKRRSKRIVNNIMASLGFFCATLTVVQAEELPALDKAWGSILIANYTPVFDFGNNGCFPAAAISRSGQENPGLNNTGAINGNCHDAGFLDRSNTYHRWVRQYSENDEYAAHMYELYFEKDQALPGSGGHRHDVETVIIYFKNQQPTHVAVSAHGNYTRREWNDVNKIGNQPKIFYKKDGSGNTHIFDFGSASESAENPYGAWVTPPIVSWYEVYGDGISNSTMRYRFNNADFGSASMKFKDSNFKDEVNRSDTLPTDDDDDYPPFTEDSVNASQWSLEWPVIMPSALMLLE